MHTLTLQSYLHSHKQRSGSWPVFSLHIAMWENSKPSSSSSQLFFFTAACPKPLFTRHSTFSFLLSMPTFNSLSAADSGLWPAFPSHLWGITCWNYCLVSNLDKPKANFRRQWKHGITAFYTSRDSYLVDLSDFP